ncbi:DUF4255 domain-containing protein [Sphingomonas sp. SUN039]|uniref:DUF4255 domain-containing protein n=1 Tax=Sphingomonas sp. SUN039 TaxID=2937787 RepID=UPI0021648096|nr:DUF4255 domain-containing protein [Sphingomonas sp. SUN039]UVO55702.1 DUF4255 domain-containing protein [Sphingomonas sp. SUN039]
MSNFRAIAAVVAALEQVVQTAANAAVGQANVSFGPPVARTKDDDPSVNICLLRVTPNAAMRNVNMPNRSGEGGLMRRSQLALDLHFVLSFYGSADNFEPERMLGAVAVALEDRPILSKSAIASGIAAHLAAIGESDLADAGTNIRITQDHFSLEEFTKLWSVFFQVPYVLSAGYLFSHVIVETDDSPAPALPVTQGGVWVGPMAQLGLDRAGAVPGGSGPIVWNGPLWILGHGMAQPGTDFLIDGTTVTVDAAQTSDRQARIPLTPANFGGGELLAGTHSVQALAAPSSPGLPAHLRQGSNILAFALQPVVALGANPLTVTSGAAPKRSGTLGVDFVPKLGEKQRVKLALDSRDPAKPWTTMLDRVAPAANSGLSTSASFAFTDIDPGTYLLRGEVDGIPSVPVTGSNPQAADYLHIVGPELVVP